MASYYWMKLWIEILDDPKIGPLPDWLWRRFIELMLVAKEFDKDGDLPPLTDVAWRLRLPTDEIVKALEALVEIGVVHRKAPDLFCLTNFKKRQSPMKPSERKSRQRNRDIEQAYYCHEYVTIGDIEAEEDTEAESRGGGKQPNAFEVYEQEIGILTPQVNEFLKFSIDTYSEKWVLDAIRIAVQNNARNWHYCEAILKRWKTQGNQLESRQKNDHSIPQKVPKGLETALRLMEN